MSTDVPAYVRRASGDRSARRVRRTPEVVAALRG